MMLGRGSRPRMEIPYRDGGHYAQDCFGSANNSRKSSASLFFGMNSLGFGPLDRDVLVSDDQRQVFEHGKYIS